MADSSSSAQSIPEMDDAEFARWQTLLEEKTGVWLPRKRKSFLVSSLNQRMKVRGFSAYSDYFNSLALGGMSAVEWASLVDLLTVHETRFFRDQESLQLAKNHCLKKVDEQIAEGKDTINLQLWSVGCATGEEVYSLALLLAQLEKEVKQENNKNLYFGVTGVDISFPSLAAAREGIYHRRKIETIPLDLRHEYFEAKVDDYFQVKSSLRQRTCFVQGNVQELANAPVQSYDVVFCQNVLIYFQQPRRESILNNLVARVKPGGLLILGPGEVVNWQHDQLARVQNKHCLAFIRQDDA